MTVTAWRQFDVTVRRTQRVSPSMVRVTLGGEDLRHFGDAGLDCRFKLVLPLDDSGLRHLPRGPEWYTAWRELPPEQRNPVRTYTVRSVRSAHAEVDVDMLSHGDSGPATRWLQHAQEGTEAVLIGPNARYQDGPWGGVEYAFDPEAVQDLLLAGDETALPAIAVILESLPDHACGSVYLETAPGDEVYPLTAPEGMSITWVPRSDPERPGDDLVRAVANWSPRLPTGESEVEVEVAAEEGGTMIWEAASTVHEPARPTDRHPLVWAWIAGESGAVTTIRRRLVRELHLPKDRVAFMGYWKQGRSGA